MQLAKERPSRNSELFKFEALTARRFIVETTNPDGTPAEPTSGYTPGKYTANVFGKGVVAILPISENVRHVRLGMPENHEIPSIHPDAKTAIVTHLDVHFVSTSISDVFGQKTSAKPDSPNRGKLAAAINFVKNRLGSKSAPETISPVESFFMAMSDKVRLEPATRNELILGARAFAAPSVR